MSREFLQTFCVCCFYARERALANQAKLVSTRQPDQVSEHLLTPRSPAAPVQKLVQNFEVGPAPVRVLVQNLAGTACASAKTSV